MELLVHPTAEAVATAAADRIAGLIDRAADRFTLGLAGGSTPEATYRVLRTRAVAWGKVDAWLSDERWVPPHHERSNGRMAAVALMDHVGARFHRPRWSEYMTAADSAAHYEARIRSIHGVESPDLILLGLGKDGHTASLFPGTKALNEGQRWYVANHVPQLGEVRLTATFPLLWRARLLMVIVTGGHKAAAVRASFDGSTPAGRLDKGEATVEWFVDEEAASLVV